MKRKTWLLCPVLALTLAANAFALEVPSDTVVQNLNGSQQVIKTYTLALDADPQELIEEPFILEGYRYTFADIVKKENLAADTASHTETVTVETEKKDLSAVLEALAPTMEYDDGTYSGVLALDHTTIHTEAAGYSSGSRTVTEVKTIGPLDRNDMSYVPAATVKDGRTLTLSNVEWQVVGTDLVGEALAPSSYQAVATYTGKASYSYATGYISTADYVGEITRDEVESVTYRLTYLGEVDSGSASDVEEGKTIPAQIAKTVGEKWPYLLSGVALLAVVILAVALARSRRRDTAFHEVQDGLLDEVDEREEEGE